MWFLGKKTKKETKKKPQSVTVKSKDDDSYFLIQDLKNQDKATILIFKSLEIKSLDGRLTPNSKALNKSLYAMALTKTAKLFFNRSYDLLMRSAHPKWSERVIAERDIVGCILDDILNIRTGLEEPVNKFQANALKILAIERWIKIMMICSQNGDQHSVNLIKEALKDKSIAALRSLISREVKDMYKRYVHVESPLIPDLYEYANKLNTPKVNMEVTKELKEKKKTVESQVDQTSLNPNVNQRETNFYAFFVPTYSARGYLNLIYDQLWENERTIEILRKKIAAKSSQIEGEQGLAEPKPVGPSLAEQLRHAELKHEQIAEQIRRLEQDLSLPVLTTITLDENENLELNIARENLKVTGLVPTRQILSREPSNASLINENDNSPSTPRTHGHRPALQKTTSHPNLFTENVKTEKNADGDNIEAAEKIDEKDKSKLPTV